METYRVDTYSGGSYVIVAASPHDAAIKIGRLYKQYARGVCLAKDTAYQFKNQPNLLLPIA